MVFQKEKDTKLEIGTQGQNADPLRHSPRLFLLLFLSFLPSFRCINQQWSYLDLQAFFHLRRKTKHRSFELHRNPFHFLNDFTFCNDIVFFSLFCKYFLDPFVTALSLLSSQSLNSTLTETRSKHFLSLTIRQASFPRHIVIVLDAKLPIAF